MGNVKREYQKGFTTEIKYNFHNAQKNISKIWETQQTDHIEIQVQLQEKLRTEKRQY